MIEYKDGVFIATATVGGKCVSKRFVPSPSIARAAHRAEAWVQGAQHPKKRAEKRSPVVEPSVRTIHGKQYASLKYKSKDGKWRWANVSTEGVGVEAAMKKVMCTVRRMKMPKRVRPSSSTCRTG